MESEAETEFSVAVHDLLGCLHANGIGLVLLPPPNSKAGDDIVEKLKDGVRHFARVRGFGESGEALLTNYLCDHIFEQGATGFERVPVLRVLLQRAASDEPRKTEND